MAREGMVIPSQPPEREPLKDTLPLQWPGRATIFAYRVAEDRSPAWPLEGQCIFQRLTLRRLRRYYHPFASHSSSWRFDLLRRGGLDWGIGSRLSCGSPALGLPSRGRASGGGFG